MANRIDELRRKRNETQEDIAKLFGVTQSTVSGWETERRQADHRTLRKLADHFGVTIDYLLCREEDQPLPYQTTREILAGPGVRILLDTDASLTDDQLREIVEFIEFKQRHGNR